MVEFQALVTLWEDRGWVDGIAGTQWRLRPALNCTRKIRPHGCVYKGKNAAAQRPGFEHLFGPFPWKMTWVLGELVCQIRIATLPTSPEIAGGLNVRVMYKLPGIQPVLKCWICKQDMMSKVHNVGKEFKLMPKINFFHTQCPLTLHLPLALLLRSVDPKHSSKPSLS